MNHTQLSTALRDNLPIYVDSLDTYAYITRIKSKHKYIICKDENLSSRKVIVDVIIDTKASYGSFTATNLESSDLRLADNIEKLLFF